jgi:hypothetical protein
VSDAATERVDEAGVCYHAINRGNARQEIFHQPDVNEAFIRVEVSHVFAIPRQAEPGDKFTIGILFYVHRKMGKWDAC